MYYNRIDILKRIVVTKSYNSKECIICYYWFFSCGFELQDSICNGCHDLTIYCLDISDISIIAVNGIDCRYIVILDSKSEAIHLLKNSMLEIMNIFKKANQY